MLWNTLWQNENFFLQAQLACLFTILKMYKYTWTWCIHKGNWVSSEVINEQIYWPTSYNLTTTDSLRETVSWQTISLHFKTLLGHPDVWGTFWLTVLSLLWCIMGPLVSLGYALTSPFSISNRVVQGLRCFGVHEQPCLVKSNRVIGFRKGLVTLSIPIMISSLFLMLMQW